MTIQSTHSNPVQSWAKRPDGVTLIAGYHFVVAALFLLGTLIMALPTVILGVITIVEDSEAIIGMVATGLIATVLMSLSLLNLVIGYGLWQMRAWGRTAAIALAVVSLFAVPIGTVTGGITLWYLLQLEMTTRFE
jgi:uncharacterized membrane protein (DUF2068 family)